MSKQENPRALLERMTPEKLAKMREIAEKIAKWDERTKISKETTTVKIPPLRNQGESNERNA